MDNKITGKIKKYNSSHTKRQWLYRALSIVAAFAVFCTTYVLILPAITLDSGTVGHRHDNSCYAYSKETKKLTCPVTVHEHEDKCFDENDLCICGYSDFIVHTHDEMCYDEDKNLLCNMSEIAVHEHTDECYSIKDKELICEEADSHEHTDECYAPQEKELICEKDEIVLHTHTEECIDENSKIICEKTEIKEHQHTEDCFTIEITAYDEPILICGLEEYTRTAKDCAAEFAKLVKDMPDSSEKEYFDAYYTAYDAYSLALDMYYEENPYDGQDDFDEWLKELGYYDEFETFTSLPDPNNVTTYAGPSTSYNPNLAVAENTKIHLFNYGSQINQYKESILRFSGVTGDNDMTVTTTEKDYHRSSRDIDLDNDKIIHGKPKMLPVLKDGYPYALQNVINNASAVEGSLKYLFDKSKDFVTTGASGSATSYDPTKNTNYVSKHFEVKNNGEGNGLFWQDDEGYLVFDSAFRRAYFNPTNSKFELYDYAVRPFYGSENFRGQGHFLPFNNDFSSAVQITDSKGNIITQNITAAHLGTYTGTATDGTTTTKNFLELMKVYAQKNPEVAQIVPNLWVLTEQNKPNVNLSKTADYFYGMTVEFDFHQPKDGFIDGNPMIFDFLGDDDVWVYIDDVLVLNIGGTHNPMTGDINFSTGIVNQPLPDKVSHDLTFYTTDTLRNIFKSATDYNGNKYYTDSEINEMFGDGDTFVDYSQHTLKFFYMERGAGSLNCRMRFNMTTLPNNSLTVGKEIEVDSNTGDSQIDAEINDEIKQSLSYKFRVRKVNENGISSENDVLFKNATFKLTEEGKTDSIGIVDKDGVFTLKSGQRAVFERLLDEYNIGDCTFVVEELIPDDLLAQYTGTYSGAVELQQGETTYQDAEGNSYTAFVTEKMTISDDGAAYFTVFQNKINVDTLSKLKITKSRALGAGFDKNTVFNMNVTLGGEPIPVGTVYKIGNNEYTVQTEGVIPLKAGQTAIIEGILSGTEFRVAEQVTDSDGYIVTYSGKITANGETTNLTAPPNEGTFPLASTVHITVTNADYDFNASIPLLKTTPNFQNGEKAEFTFNVTEVTLNEESGEWERTAILPDVYIPVEETVTESNIVIGYRSADAHENSIHYYLVEEADTDGYICDKAYYLVKVELKIVDGNYTAESTILERNGEEYTGEKLEFTNYRSAIFTVTKTVTGEAADGIFPFEAIISNKGDFILPEGSNYAIDGNSPNIFTFNLRNGEKFEIELPVGTTINLTETEHTGYIPSFTIDNSTEATHSNVVKSVSVPTTGVTVHFNNRTGTVLPSTGGTGTSVYTLGGLLVAGAAAGLLVYKTRSRKKE